MNRAFKRLSGWKGASALIAFVGIVLLILLITDQLALSDVISLFLTAVLAIVTVVYAGAADSQAKWTKQMAIEAERQGNEARRQRMDSLRPLLLPQGNLGALANVTLRQTMFVSGVGLEVRNIGAGPAANIRVRLERRELDRRDKESTLISTVDDNAYVQPLGAGQVGKIHQMKPNEVPDSGQYWLVVSCTDGFNRRHSTEACYDWQIDEWVNITTKCEGD